MAKPIQATDPLVRELITPEGVDLRLSLATAGERATAFLLDVAIMVGILIGFSLLAMIALTASIGRKVNIGAPVEIIWLLGAFVLRNLYFTIFELTPRAATPGKRIVGLRVMARNGSRLRADAIFARNAMRELEVYLPLGFLFANARGIDGWLVTLGTIWCGVFVLFPIFNRDRLRAGDLAAGTWVVRTPRPRLLRDLAVAIAKRSPSLVFSPEQLDAYGIKELQILEDVLRRADPKTVTAVAQRIRAKLAWRRGHETTYEFLEAYYQSLRGHLESKLLLGRRRRDKYDTP